MMTVPSGPGGVETLTDIHVFLTQEDLGPDIPASASNQVTGCEEDDMETRAEEYLALGVDKYNF